MTADLRRDLPIVAEMLDAGRLPEAKPLLDELLRLHPLDSYVLYNLGLWHWHSQHPRDAVAYWRKAIGANPNLLPAIVNLGSALYALGDLREALRYAQMAIRRKPGDAQLLSNLGQVLTSLGEAKDALGAIDDALACQPDHLPSLVQRMIILTDLGQLKPALEAGEAVIKHPQGSQSVDALNNLASLASKFSDWKALERYTSLLHEAVKGPGVLINPMALTFCFDDPVLFGTLAHRRAGRMPPIPARPTRSGRSGRITIAYMSPDLREHPVAHMILEILRQHDRSRFAIYTVGTLPDDTSPLAEEIAKHTDGHIDLTRMDDSQAAVELRRMEVDVLVDLAGTTKWCRPGILAKRPCPAQILWLGCPCTTGTHYYDAFLVDEIVAPPGYEAYCTEPLIRLPCCYHPISLGQGSPSPTITRARAKLPESRTIVGILQQPNKIRPPLIDHVVSTVAGHTEAHLWVRIHQDGISAAKERFAQAGLPPDRQHFAMLYHHRNDYLAIHGLVDIIVDSFPYGGHSTTGEALIQGTPVLTVAGSSIHTRVAASMLHELGLDELVMPDFASLRQTLDGYLGDKAKLEEIKTRCRDAAMNYKKSGITRLTRALEDAFARVLAQAT